MSFFFFAQATELFAAGVTVGEEGEDPKIDLNEKEAAIEVSRVLAEMMSQESKPLSFATMKRFSSFFSKLSCHSYE